MFKWHAYAIDRFDRFDVPRVGQYILILLAVAHDAILHGHDQPAANPVQSQDGYTCALTPGPQLVLMNVRVNGCGGAEGWLAVAFTLPSWPRGSCGPRLVAVMCLEIHTSVVTCHRPTLL